MSKQQELEVCEACGVTAEMGFVIGEGDDVADVSIFATDKQAAITEFDHYLALAKEVNPKVVHDFQPETDFALDPLKVKLKFECSAEKLIFELRSRALAK